MKQLPKIKVLSASESESESSSSLEEMCLNEEASEIDIIGSVHKDLQRKLTYQLMQYKNTSRQLLQEAPSSTLVSTNETHPSPLTDSFETKPAIQTIQTLLHLTSSFQASQLELETAKKSISQIENDSDGLYAKLRNLEKKISDRQDQLLLKQTHCSCQIA